MQTNVARFDGGEMDGTKQVAGGHHYGLKEEEPFSPLIWLSCTIWSLLRDHFPTISPSLFLLFL